MNAALFQKVKDLTKNTGVSEKYLKSITEKMGGKIEDDSTDTEAIEECANLIAEVVSETQSEATRWAQKQRKKQSKKSAKSEDDEDEEDDENDDDDEDDDDEDGKGKKKSKKSKSSKDRLKALEDEIAQLKAERAGSQRKSEIEALMEKHKIPSYLRARLAKSVGDDEDAEEIISTFKQELITAGLSEKDEGGAKVASQKDVESAADDLLESITVKKE